jgi:hypothetical protein
VTSVLIDRGVGVGLLIVLGFVVLLLPSGLTALSGYRDVVLIVYGALILAGAMGLLLAPKIASPLARWRYSRWFATLAARSPRGIAVAMNTNGLTLTEDIAASAKPAKPQHCELTSCPLA